MNDKNKFLEEIHEKINKRSKGLYYNKKLKTVKKNLFITSLSLIIIISIWAIANFYYQKISFKKKIIPSQSSKKLSPPQKENKPIETNKSEIKKIKKIEKEKMFHEKQIISKQKFRYIFTLKESLSESEAMTIYKILKKHKKTEGKDYYIYSIKDEELKPVLKRLTENKKLNLKKESYRDISNYNDISLKKEILDIILKK